MIIEIPDDNSIVKWKNDEKDEWKVAEISDLIKAYERPQVTVFAENADEKTVEELKAELEQVINEARTQGEWVAREDLDYLDENKVVHNHFECNKCGLIHDFIDGHTSQYNFCPQCGKRLQKGGAE